MRKASFVRARLGLPVCLLSLLLWPAKGLAQDASAENVAAARTLGIQGVELANAGKCDQAIEKLSRAEALYHAPTILGRLGECQVAVGQVVLGTENLNRVVREQLPANAPLAYRTAQERAKKALDAALPKIAYLTVTVEPRDAKVEVKVGGAPLSSALIGVERPTDPGTHEIVATAPGYLEARSSVTLAEGGHQSVALALPLDPNAKPATPPPADTIPPGGTLTPPPGAEPPPEPQSSSGTKTLGYVLLGVGGVGIVAGSVTGIMAIGAKGDLDCPENRCAGKEGDDLESAKTIAMVSTISFAVGIPAAAVGVVLLVTGGSKSETGKLDKPKGFSAKPYFGLGEAGVVGTF
jgi:hypothetical protein